MQVTREDISDSRVKLNISVGLEMLTHAKQSELQKHARDMKVSGFRQGKAPLTIVEKQLDENQLQASVINHAINDAYGDAIESEKLRTLDQPEVTVGKFVPYTELDFSAEVDIVPPVKLADYKKIKKQAPKIKITEKDITEVIDNLRERSAVKNSVKRAAKNTDEVILDFDGINKKGDKVAGASGADYALVLGSNTFIPGFEEALVGAKKDDKKEIKLKFPKEYHAAELAGTDITFNVVVKDVKEVVLPKADNAFAKTLGPFEDLEELKKDIKKQLEEQKLVEKTNKLKDEIVEELVTGSTLTIPDVLVSDQLAALEQDFMQNLIYRGITKEEYLKQQKFDDENAWKQKELTPQAERRVSVGLVLAAVADAENIMVSDEELQERIVRHKQEYAQQAAEFDKPEMQREVSSRIITEKTVNLLYELATKK